MDARPASDGALIVCDNLVKIYKVADLEVVALQGLDLLVERGEFIALVGASGSGKSTLMNILGGLDVPSAGRATVDGHLLGEMGRQERTALPAPRRLRVAADGAQPAALSDRAPERRAAHDARRRRARRAPAADARTCSGALGWPTAPITSRIGCRAASSSARRSPSRWPTIRRCSSPTSQRASSTRRPRTRSSMCCAPSTASWA